MIRYIPRNDNQSIEEWEEEYEAAESAYEDECVESYYEKLYND